MFDLDQIRDTNKTRACWQLKLF